MADIPHAERYLGRRVINWLVIALLALLAIVLILVLCGRVLFVGPWTIGINYPSRDVPVGTVLPFWGALADIPKGFELCNGRQVSTEGSPLLGADKPDLSDNFIKGAKTDVADVRKPLETGGTNELVLKHAHPSGGLFACITQQAVSGNDFNIPLITRGQFTPTNGGFRLKNQTVSAGITGRWSGREDNTPNGTAVEGSTAEALTTPFDNRPKFVALYFIIKVR